MTAGPIWSLLRRSMTRASVQAVLAVLGLLAGVVCHLADAAGVGDVLWQVTIVVTVVPVTWEVVRAMAQGDFGAHVLAEGLVHDAMTRRRGRRGRGRGRVGYLPPVAGALLQEGIDVAVILNALRALRG